MLLRLCLLLIFLNSATLVAQETATSAADTATAAAPATKKVNPELALRLASPRSCLNSFFEAFETEDWEVAVSCLDFSGFPSPVDVRTTNGQLLAYQLKQILDSVNLETLVPEQPDYDQPCRLSDYARDDYYRELEASKKTDFDAIVIAQSKDDGLWRFAPGTVLRIEELHERWAPKLKESSAFDDTAKPMAVWLAEKFPEQLKAKHLLIADYMWILLAAVVGLGFLADALVGLIAINVSQRLFGVTRSKEKDAAVRQLWKPFGLLLQAIIWYFGMSKIGIPTWATNYLSIGLRFFGVFAAIWVVFRLIDLASGYLASRAERTASKFDDVLIPLISTIAKIVGILMGILICAETFNFNVNTLLGGLGIGGMALALASKDAVSNLFGSFTVLIDRPFEIGDWVITEDIEGTVEQVGFRSTRIRTFYNSLITLPNSRLTTAVVDNMGRRRYRRVKAVLGVQYSTTPDQLDAFCEGIRELIRRSSATRKDYFHVYFNGFNESSLDILVYFFLRVPDWSNELKEKHKLFNEILRLAHELNVEFAFPTRTLHMHARAVTPTGPSGVRESQVSPEHLGRQSAAHILETATGTTTTQSQFS